MRVRANPFLVGADEDSRSSDLHSDAPEVERLREELGALKLANHKLRGEIQQMLCDHDDELERLRKRNWEMARQIMMLGGTQPEHAGC